MSALQRPESTLDRMGAGALGGLGDKVLRPTTVVTVPGVSPDDIEMSAPATFRSSLDVLGGPAFQSFPSLKPDWIRTYSSGPLCSDGVQDMKIAPDGSIVTVGWAYGDVTMSDSLVVKWSPDGDVVWARRFNSPNNGSDWPTAMSIDAAGNIYVAGDRLVPGVSQSAMLLKYSPTGELEWSRLYDSASTAHDVECGPAGSIYVTGWSQWDSSTWKYDSQGTLVWVRRFDDGKYDASMAFALAVDSAGAAYVSGVEPDDSSGQQSIRTTKYSTVGEMEWSDRFSSVDSGATHEGRPYDVVLAPDGRCLVVGQVSTESTETAMGVICYSPHGQRLWVATCPAGTTMGWGRRGAVDSSGRVAVAGACYGGEYGSGGSQADGLTATFSEDGTLRWYSKYVTWEYQTDVDVAVDADGCVYTAGGSSLDGGGIFGTHYITTKFSPNGTILWRDEASSGYSGGDRAAAIALADDASVMVAGGSPWGDAVDEGGSHEFDTTLLKYRATPSTPLIYSLTPTSGDHGSIAPASPQTVDYGGSKTFTITAEPGYHIADVLVDGTSVGAVTSHTFTNVTANHTISATFAADATPATRKNVYRFRNLQNGFYLWSADESEKAHIIGNLSRTWKYEGVAYTRNTVTNTAPLWRFRNLRGGFYLYSADPAEKDTIVRTLSNEWQLEGPAYSVSRASGSPVWRFRNKQDGTYLLSADPNEKDTIVRTLSDTWQLEGPAFYIAQ